MLRKKICMIGAPTVGKSSLVRRYVHGLFSESYLSTIGVKVDKKSLDYSGTDVELLLWDIHGDDEFARIRSVYLRGTAGYFLVADGTRPRTLEHAIDLQARVSEELGPTPFVLLINKSDMEERWAVTDEKLAEIKGMGWSVLLSSAKTGDAVEEAFKLLVQKMMG